MPKISVIVPCFNEEATISQLLDAIYHQSYPLSEIEVIIADGFSTDHTRDIVQLFQSNHPDLPVRIVDNHKRAIPSGLNRAVEVAQGDYLLRMDAHSIPDQDYIENSVRNLESDMGDNVGGVWKIQPGADTWIAKSIALTAAHPIGVGDALYRIGGAAQEVDTVPFGAFKRKLIDKIGKFDESLLTNEDYEFNTRIRRSGGKVWLDPSIKSKYYARSTLKELSRQYWRYGYWKAQMLRRYPRTLRLRQLIPPLFIFSLLSLGFLSLFSILARWLFSLVVLLYILVIILVGIQMSLKHKSISLFIGVPLALATIHFSWGTGLLWGLIYKPR